MKIKIPLLLLCLLIGSFTGFSKVHLLPVNTHLAHDPAAKAKLPFVFDEKAYVVSGNPSLPGADFVQYLGDGHYLYNMDVSVLEGRTEPLSYLDPAYKFMKDVNLSDNRGAYDVVVVYARGSNAGKIGTELYNLNVNITEWNEAFNRIKLTASKKTLMEIAKLPFVLVISKNYVHKNSLIYEGMMMNRATEITGDQPFGYNLKGAGMNIGIWDDGAIGPHFSLAPTRVFNIDKEYAFGIYLSHPTFVAGSAGMSHSYFNILQGPSTESEIYSWDYYNDIIQEIKNGIAQYGLNVTNHSYNFANTTCSESGLYIPEAADLDKLIRDYPKVLHTIAVGNTGLTCIDTFNSVDIGFQGSKNVITVGWLFTPHLVVPNSGRGPTTDGRLKPELTTKGFGVQTTAPYNNFGLTYGSSFAAPQVAGIITLLQQRYKQQFSEMPNASLLKAILCNTTRDLGNPGPDYSYGFGRPDALKAVRTIENEHFYENSISTGEVQVQSFSVPAGTGQTAVTLCWTDVEGFPYADVILVNDLDVKLVTPSNDTILPWTLDPVNYTKNAKRLVDKLNNTEKITLDYPQAGVYQVVVKGSNIPQGPQLYSVAYDNTPIGIDVTYPDGGEILDAGGVYAIHWNYFGNDTLVNIEYSTDGGNTWNFVANNVNVRNGSYTTWSVPGVLSKKCKIRLNYNGILNTSDGLFTIGQQVNYGTIAAQVCDRTARLTWGAVPSATAYRVYLFKDDTWQFLAQTTLTNYTINNLVNGKSYLYSVSCIKDSVESNHSLANLITPSPVACTQTNDAGVYALYRPQVGRLLTSMQLTAAEKLSFVIKNFGSNTIANFNVRYRINNGPTRTQLHAPALVGGDSSILEFAVTENLSALGNYTIKAWPELPSESNFGNDTLVFTIRNLSNPALTLPFTESFEADANTITFTGYGVNGTTYADFIVEPGGRARTDEYNTFALSGTKGLTLDNYRELAFAKNEYVFTLNLSKYIDTTVFLNFAFMNRGEPDGDDKIYARGADDKPWIELYDLFAGTDSYGRYKQVKEINLYHLLKVMNNQSFSTSSQIKISTKSLKKATDPYSAGGYSFDDLVVYSANFDVALKSATLQQLSCQQSFQPLPLTILIQNNSKDTVKNLPVSYSVNNGMPVTEIVAVNIRPFDTLTYTFVTKINTPQSGYYSVKTWVSRAADYYRLNDSITTLRTLVLPSINSFPYYNDFESAPALVANGENSSWAWGTPSKYLMRGAAQGLNCWATNLYGNYNYSENSYLYLGCYDFSALTTDPLFGFNHLENIATNNDTLYAEISGDGIVWKRLGCVDCGDNWYENSNDKNYWDETTFPWQVANTPIMLDSLDNPASSIIRLHLQSDISGNGEGFGVDDLHVYTDIRDIAITDSFYTSAVSTGSGWITLLNDGKTIIELHDGGQALGTVSLGYYARTSGVPTFMNRNYVPRNWVIRAQNAITTPVKIRLYVLNQEYVDFIFEEDSSFSMGDIHMLRYYGLNTNLAPEDNHVRSYYKFFTPDDIQFYPVKSGYYVEFETDSLGEFYLISGKTDPDAIPGINLVNLTVVPVNDDAYLEWETTTETNSNSFVIQYSFDGINFINLDTVPSANNSNSLIDYNYIHEINATNAVFYYRIRMVFNNGTSIYSLIDSVRFTSATPVFTNTKSIHCFMSNEDVIIDNNRKLSGKYTARLIRTDGAVIFTRNMTFAEGWNPLGVRNFSSLAKGTYLLELYNDNERYYAKMVKAQ